MENEIEEPQHQVPRNADVKVAPNLDEELDAALSKQFGAMAEPKQEAPPESPKAEQKPIEKEVKETKATAKEEPKAEVKKDDDVPVDPTFIEKLSPQSKDGWKILKEAHGKNKRLLQEIQEENRKLKESIAQKGSMSQKEAETLKTQLDEMSKYRAMVDIQADPEFISKYEQPIEKGVVAIKEMLMKMGVGEQTVDTIDFSNTAVMDQVIEVVGKHQDSFVTRKLRHKVEELMDLSDKRIEFLEGHKKNYKEYVENKKKETFSKTAEEEGRLLRHIENIRLGKDEKGENKASPIPFLNKQALKEGASDLENRQIEDHNRMVDMLNHKIQEAVSMKTPEQKAEVAIAAVSAIYLSAQLKAVISENQSLKKELEKVASINSESTKSKPASPRRNGSQPMEIQDVDSALAEHFRI